MGFKIEALAQSLSTTVTMLSPQRLSSYAKKADLPSVKMFSYQEEAFKVACCGADAAK